MKENQNLELIKRIKALAETGLVYVKDEYDRERYEELRDISLQLLSRVSDRPLTTLHNFFMPEKDYPTPKVDVRGLIFNLKDEILMVKERVDGKWTLPGGWCDVGFTPSQVIVKEIREETGMQSEVVRLLAIYDKQMHPHPPQPFYVYKLNFLCKVIGGEFNPGFDVEDVGYFSLTDLPPLSKDRILESQIRQLCQLATSGEKEVYFD